MRPILISVDADDETVHRLADIINEQFDEYEEKNYNVIILNRSAQLNTVEEFKEMLLQILDRIE